MSSAKRFTPTTTAVAGVDRLLRAVGSVLDLALDVAGLDRGQRTAQAVDAFDQLARFALDPVRPLLDRVGAAERIDRVGHTAFVQDDLLRPQRNRGAFLGRQRQRLVAAVAVERLRAAEHRRQRLQRDPHDVVVRLLRRQRAAGRLRVKTQLLCARVRGAGTGRA